MAKRLTDKTVAEERPLGRVSMDGCNNGSRPSFETAAVRPPQDEGKT
jgi:hypothetical protein